jgi:hypothetical protein
MAKHVGRAPDFLWRARRVHHLGAALVFAAWIGEKKFYAARTADFHAKDVFSIDDVRAVRIEWDTVEGSRGNVFKAAYQLAIEVCSVETPLIKVDAGDEPTAAKMQELLRQMAEKPNFFDGVLSPRVTSPPAS